MCQNPLTLRSRILITKARTALILTPLESACEALQDGMQVKLLQRCLDLKPKLPFCSWGQEIGHNSRTAAGFFMGVVGSCRRKIGLFFDV